MLIQELREQQDREHVIREIRARRIYGLPSRDRIHKPFYGREKVMSKAIAAAAAKRAAELKQSGTKQKPQAKKAAKKRSEGTYDRNAKFECEVKGCGKTITGPWSYKQHLIKQHDYTPEQAGLTPRNGNGKKTAKKSAKK